MIMNKRKIIKGYKTLISTKFKVDTSKDKFKDGIIYTLYSDEFNSLKVGFAENDKVLEKKLSSEALILLDMKKGKKNDRASFMWNCFRFVPITLLGLFVSAWNQYRRGSGMLDID